MRVNRSISGAGRRSREGPSNRRLPRPTQPRFCATAIHPAGNQNLITIITIVITTTTRPSYPRDSHGRAGRCVSGSNRHSSSPLRPAGCRRLCSYQHLSPCKTGYYLLPSTSLRIRKRAQTRQDYLVTSTRTKSDETCVAVAALRRPRTCTQRRQTG